MTQTHIPIDQCVHGRLYRLSSRNLGMGVYNQANKGFVGIREKFGSEYLSTEYHWDTGAPHGTARPLEDLGPCPVTDLNESHLIAVTAEMAAKSEWLKEGETCWRTNKELMDWLDSKRDQPMTLEEIAKLIPENSGLSVSEQAGVITITVDNKDQDVPIPRHQRMTADSLKAFLDRKAHLFQ